jgi:hypothetical protein
MSFTIPNSQKWLAPVVKHLSTGDARALTALGASANGLLAYPKPPDAHVFNVAVPTAPLKGETAVTVLLS